MVINVGSRFVALGLGTRGFLVSLEKEFKETEAGEGLLM
jgi:hypothetical protein